MVEVKPINIFLNQLSPGLSVRTAISPTLTEELIIHPSVYAEIKNLGHVKSDVLLSESGSSLGVHFNSNVSVSMQEDDIHNVVLRLHEAVDHYAKEALGVIWESENYYAILEREKDSPSGVTYAPETPHCWRAGL
ncbi:hypothetical protein TNCV_1114701 [Trichonephila clavipes]|nr:hypothetical protein TNCV_1114701 [Trichonephila clavipes]